MTIGPLRLLVVAASALALVAPASSLASAKAPAVDRGVVQAVDASHIVLRPLDGSTVSFDVVPATKVRVNGRAASIADVAPGYVADVVANRKHRALLIRAFGKPAISVATDHGTVSAVARASVTIALDGGGSLTVGVDRATKVRGGASLGRRSAVRPGAVVSVTHAPGGHALVITIVKRAGA